MKFQYFISFLKEQIVEHKEGGKNLMYLQMKRPHLFLEKLIEAWA